MKNRNRIQFILGGLFFLVALGLFLIQMGYLLLHNRLQMEYIDNRLFYIINISIVISIFLGGFILFSFTRKFKAIASSLIGIFIVVNIVLLYQSNQEIKNIVSISPDFKHVFSVKENAERGEVVYYRSYYGIVARPKERLSGSITGAYEVKWLADDVAVFTYETSGGEVQAFAGTYGDRGQGSSYYYVGPEMQGLWANEGVEVVSNTEGIQVKSKTDTAFFEWDQIHQYGTLAIVLEQDQEAEWVIGLNEDFQMRSDASNSPGGSISLYKAAIGSEELYELEFKSEIN